MPFSSDVNAAYDPTFADVFEANNSCYINKGLRADQIHRCPRQIRIQRCQRGDHGEGHWHHGKEGVYWQAGELGAVDQGGGGTIAKYVAHLNIDVVDLGVPILSMHAPFELSSKLDVYNTYKAFCAFLQIME